MNGLLSLRGKVNAAERRGETYLGEISLPCCMREPMVNHMELQRENSFTNTSASSLQGWGLSHSYGLNLEGEAGIKSTN